MQIIMVVGNSVVNDTRVMKSAKELKNNGFEITVFGVDNQDKCFNVEGINIVNSRYPLLTRIISKFTSNSGTSSNSLVSEKSRSVTRTIKNEIHDLLKGIFILKNIQNIQNVIYRRIKSSMLKANFIHCHDLDTLKVGIRVKKRHKSILIYDSHELWTEMSGINKFVRKKFYLYEKKHMNSIDYLITVSPSIIKELKLRYNSSKPSILLRNIPDIQEINPVNYPDKSKIKGIYIGYYINGRGVENLLISAIDFPDNFELTLVVQNDLNIISHLEKFIINNRLEKKVNIMSFIPQEKLLDELSKYDIGFLPYLPVSLNNYFCLPNKIFQYLSSGVAVISYNLPDVNDILLKYKCGLVYDDNDTMIENIKILCNDVDTLFQMKNQAQKSAKEEFNWELEKMKLLDIYNTHER